MKIGVDALCISSQKTGIGYYLDNILRFLIEQNSEHEFYLFTRYKLYEYEKYKNVKIITNKYKCSFFKDSVWVRYFIYSYCRKNNINVFWGPNQILPRFLPDSCKKILTIHDMSFKIYPETIKFETAMDLKLNFKKSLEAADIILTVSDFTTDELSRFYNISNKKVIMASSGVNYEDFFNIEFEKCREMLQKEYSINSEFILSISTIEPRKNLIVLIKALKLLIEDYGMDIKLVLVGKKGWKNGELSTYIKENNLEKNIIFSGYVPYDHLKYFYSACKLFINPSIYEGFGLPNIEALACGAKILASDISVFKEILGDNVIYFNKYDFKQLAHLIYDNYNEKRQKQIVSKYTWLRCAQLISPVLIGEQDAECDKAI